MIVTSLATFLITPKMLSDTLYLLSDNLAKHYEVSFSLINKLNPIQSLGVIIGAILGGPISDKIGAGKTILFTLLLLILTPILMVSTKNLWVLAICRLVSGVCVGLAFNSSFVALGKIYNGKKLQKASSLLYIFLFLNAALDPIAIKLLLKIVSCQTIYFLFSAISLLGALLCYKYLYHIKPNEIKNNYLVEARKLFKKKGFIEMAAICMICMGGFYSYIMIFQIFFASGETSVFGLTLFDIQSMGRASALISGIVIAKIMIEKGALNSIKKGLKGKMILAALFLILPLSMNNFLDFQILIFLLLCFITGFAQPIAKAELVDVAKPIVGLGVTASSIGISSLEIVSNLLIAWAPFPFNFYTVISIFLFFSIWVLKRLKNYKISSER